MLDIIGSLEGSLHLHLPHLQLFHKWEKLCFISSFTRPRRSILLLSLPYSLFPLSAFSPFLKSKSLCHSSFSPLCYAVHIVNREVKPEWWLLVWSSGKAPVLLLTCTPVLYFSTWVQSVISVCALLLGYLFFFWLTPTWPSSEALKASVTQLESAKPETPVGF